jgi:ribosomal protein S20
MESIAKKMDEAESKHIIIKGKAKRKPGRR